MNQKSSPLIRHGASATTPPATQEGIQSKRALALCAAKRIDPGIAEGVGVFDWNGRLHFPIGDDAEGKPQYRVRPLDDGPVKVAQPKGRPLAPWWPKGRPAAGSTVTAVLICEGETDALAALTALEKAPAVLRSGPLAGVAVVALPGASTPADRLAAEMVAAGIGRAYLAFDADGAGRKAKARYIEALTAVAIEPVVVELRDGSDLSDNLTAADDPSDWLAGVLADATPPANTLDQPIQGVDARPLPAPTRELPFRSPQEIIESAPESPPYVWKGFLHHPSVVTIAGPPKCGKSTLLTALMEAVTSQATEFLGLPIENGAVVFVTEEGDSTLIHKLPRSAQVRVLTRDSIWPKPSWPELIAGAAAEAAKFDCKLLVIDTFSFWAQLAADKEKDSGAIGATLDVLIEAASKNDLAVLLVHHTKKGGGENGESLRGSSAIAGAVDVIIEMDRPDETQPFQRVLLGLSRYPDTPGSLLIERNADGSWRAIGQSDDRAGAHSLGLRDALLDTLTTDAGMDRTAIEDATGKAWRWVGPELRKMEREGLVAVDGAGVRGSPKIYRKVCAEGVQPSAHFAQETDDGEFPVCVQPSIDGTQTETKTANAEGVRFLAAHKDARTATGDEEAEAERIAAKFGAGVA